MKGFSAGWVSFSSGSYLPRWVPLPSLGTQLRLVITSSPASIPTLKFLSCHPANWPQFPKHSSPPPNSSIQPDQTSISKSPIYPLQPLLHPKQSRINSTRNKPRCRPPKQIRRVLHLLFPLR